MEWTTSKIIGLVVATSVLTTALDNVMIRRTMASSGATIGYSGPAMAGPDQSAAMQQGPLRAIGNNPRFIPFDPHELADLDQSVKDRQDVKETTGETTINLKPYVNCKLTDPLADIPNEKDHTMAELPTGVQTYGGVPFDIQGIVQLNGPSIQGGNKLWPLEITNIVIGHSFKKLHLLHSAFHIDSPGANRTFAKLILHYADGSQSELELVGGVHALRCTCRAVPPFLPMLQQPQTELGWLGNNPYLKQNNPNGMLHLYRATLDNPKPETTVTGIDFLSTMDGPAPFMVGLTIE
jgi:hypothetical protein